MGSLRNDSYDRARELDAAAIARRRGRVQDAISHYERVLRAEPMNPELLRRVAPLFVQTNEPDRAWNSYRAAAQEFLGAGFADKAIGVYREAAQLMPRTAIVWLSIAELEQARGRIVDAKLALLTGRAHYRERADVCVAADLLRRAIALDASDFDARLDLARCERKAGETQRALASLAEALALRPHSARRIRWEELRTERSWERCFAWLRALATAPPSAHHPQLARANSAPERRGVVLALRPASLKAKPAPAMGESWRAAHAS